VPSQSAQGPSKAKEKKSARKTAAVRIIEMTRWLPAVPATEIQLPGPSAAPFWLTNGVIGAELLEDEVLFDINMNDVGIREEIEVTVRGEKQKVMHSLYFFQLVVGRITDSDVPANPKHVFRPQRPSGLALPGSAANGPMPGLPGGPPLG
jgi:hypothetical protein